MEHLPIPELAQFVVATDQLSFYDCVVPEIQVVFDNVVTTAELLPAQLEATVVDNPPVTGVVFEVLDDDLEFPSGASYTLSNQTVDNLNPTAGFTADTEGTYKVRLTVSDDFGNSAESLAEIQIYDDACEAKKNAPSWLPNHYDVDDDCIVGMTDFIELAKEWLADNSMIHSETYPSDDVVYITPGSDIPCTIQAEDFDEQSGGLEISTYCQTHVAQIDGGEWIRFNSIDFGSSAAKVFRANVTSDNSSGGSIQVRLDRHDGPLAGTCTVSTYGWLV